MHHGDKIKLVIIISFCLLFVGGCVNNPQDHTNRSRVILVNIGTKDRLTLARLIDDIAKCKPKIIAIDAIFEEKDSIDHGDSVLINSIAKAGNVILSSVIKGYDIISSDSLFLKASKAQGVIIYGLDEEDLVSKFKTFVSTKDQIHMSYPVSIVSYYDLERMENIMNQTKGNQYYEIGFDNSITVGDTLAHDLIPQKCSQMQDKIVLLGYLGPLDEDSYLTRADKNKRTYSTIITANIIMNILNETFHETKE